MKERIESLMAEIAALSCKAEQEIEEARVRLLGKKGSITALFEEFRDIFGQHHNCVCNDICHNDVVFAACFFAEVANFYCKAVVHAVKLCVFHCNLNSCRQVRLGVVEPEVSSQKPYGQKRYH